MSWNPIRYQRSLQLSGKYITMLFLKNKQTKKTHIWSYFQIEKQLINQDNSK